MIRYVALLRGINVGGNKKVSMGDLRAMIQLMSSTNVKTLLNSGNVVFDNLETNEKVMTKKLEDTFVHTFGFESKMVLRTIEEIHAIIKLNPFKTVKMNLNLRLYVTFLTEKSPSILKVPYISEKKDFQIIFRTDREVFSVATVEAARTTDIMSFLEKEFGKNVTTRNWNTVQKIAIL